MLFSIIVPVYKVEKYVRQCIESILEQTYSDFELILVDDGSPDACPQICDEYACADSRVHVIHKENGGATSSRKVGLNVSQGQYILFADSDDFVKRDLLSKLADILKDFDFDVICFGYSTFPKKIRKAELSPFRAGRYNQEQIMSEIFPTLITGENGLRFPPSLWGKAFKRELVLPIQSKLQDDIVIGEDSCVSYVCLYLAESLFIMYDELYCYRVDNDSITHGKNRIFDWEEPLLRAKFYLEYMPQESFGEQVARITAHSLFNIAMSVLRAKRFCDAKKELKENLSRKAIQQIINTANFKGNKKEQLALHCLRRKKVFLMKILSKFV